MSLQKIVCGCKSISSEVRSDIGVLGGGVEWIDATGSSLGIHRHPSDDKEIKAALLRRCAFWHPTVILRREVFAWAGGYRRVVVDAEDYRPIDREYPEHFPGGQP